jgi:transcriptional regulator with XRE-family HTH domain
MAIRRRRHAVGITQQQLAELLESTQPAIAALESGAVRPSLGLLERIAHALDARLVVDFEGAEPTLATPVPAAFQPARNRCGYVFANPAAPVGGRARICNRVAGHGGQHRAVFESETPLGLWD